VHDAYELEPQDEAAQYVAKELSVRRTLDGETIEINSIRPVNPPTTKKLESNQVDTTQFFLMSR
jgi:hypothetical protein